MSVVYSSVIKSALKKTLNAIITDNTDGVEAKAVFKQWCEVKGMEDQYEDDLEVGGPGLASEKSEGATMTTGTIQEGYITRYLARTFGLKLIISEEAMDDNKYPKVIQAARRLKRAMWKTADIDATNMLVRMANTSYVGGDDQPLASASHTLPSGGTFSNRMPTAMSPSRAAVIQARSATMRLPDHDGVTEGYDLEKVVCPYDQWAVWQGLVMSEKAPEPGNFSEINVVKDLGLKVVPVKYWNNTTVDYVFITEAEGGLQFRWRKRPKAQTWQDNDPLLTNHSIHSRWARGWSDPRGAYCVVSE